MLIGDLDTGETLELEVAHCLDLDGESRGPLVVVCDGMGGGDHGHLASSVASKMAWLEIAAESRTQERIVFARQLRRSIRAANVAVREKASELGSVKMGTTAAVAGLVDGALVLALVGDCRAYIFRAGQLTQVTRDQSVVSALVSAGAITDEQARSSDRRHMILQALGPETDVDVALSLVELRRGDTLLVSSDGLHGVLEEHFLIAALLEHADDLPAALQRLLELSFSAGAPDNVTAALVAFDGEGLAAASKNDLEPRFTEIDPNEDGEASLTTTSNVGKRLAHRAGLRSSLSSPPIPATGTHAVVTVPIRATSEGLGALGPGPAEALLEARSGGRLGYWIVGIVAAVAVAVAIIVS